MNAAIIHKAIKGRTMNDKEMLSMALDKYLVALMYSRNKTEQEAIVDVIDQIMTAYSDFFEVN